MSTQSLSIYKLALTFIEGIGDINAKSLVSYCGGIEAVFKAKKSHLVKIPGIGDKIAESIVKAEALKRAEQEWNFIQKYNIRMLFYLDEDYPYRLKQCYDAPIVLYYKGNRNLNERKFVGIVGTRNATEYGKDFCKEIVAGLAKHDVTIISGLAYGIDITAHKAALNNNMDTIGVLAHGFDNLYPSQHKSVANSMINQGGLLTEFAYGSDMIKENFPKRNRIVAGMIDALIVVESAKRGGSMITAEIANNYNRDVFAMPGNTKQKYSAGCNHLIKINKAALIESIKDIEYVLGWQAKKEEKLNNQTVLPLDLPENEQYLVAYLRDKQATHIDTLTVDTGLKMSEMASSLLNLEFQNIVKSLPGKKYKLV